MYLQFQQLAGFGTKEGGLGNGNLFLSCVNESFLHIYRNVCLQCPQRPKESNGFPKIGVTDGYYGEGAGNRTWSSARAAEPSLAP